MTSFMRVARTRAEEGFFTVLACIRLLSGVTLLMSVTPAGTGEGSFTVLTCVRLLSSVSSFMSSNVAQKRKGFPTLFTCIGFFPSVDLFNILKKIRVRKGIAMLLTYAHFLPSFITNTHLNVITTFEDFPTLVKLTGSLSAVTVFMLQKAFWINEGFLTFSKCIQVLSTELIGGRFVCSLKRYRYIKRCVTDEHVVLVHMVFTKHCPVRSFPVSCGVRNLSEDCFTLTAFAVFQQSFHNSISLISSRISMVIIYVLVFLCFSYGSQVPEGLLHHISV